MPTVVDKLIIELGLDPSGFEKGRKKAAQDLLRTRDEMAKTGREAEVVAKRTAEQISRITRELLLLFGVLTGARGIQAFVADLTRANAEIGRLGVSLAESPQRMAAWGMAAERVGGSAQATAASFEKISKSLYDLHRNGQMLPKEFSQLQAASGRFIRTNAGVDTFLKDTAAALKAVAAVDPSRAYFLAQGMGIDASTARVMIQYGEAVDKYLTGIEKSLAPSEAAIKASQEMGKQVAILQQNFEKFASLLMEKIQPVLARVVESITKWIEENGEWLATGIVEAVEKFAKWLGEIDWKAVTSGAATFASAVGDITNAIGGLTVAVEALFALWLGSKFLRVLANMRALSMGGGAGAAGGGGLMALLTRVGPWLAMLSLSGDTPGGGQRPEDDTPEQAARRKMLWQQAQLRIAQRAGYKEYAASRIAGQGYDALYDRMEDHGEGRDWTNPGVDPTVTNSVDGRPVSRSNPMPVTITDRGSSGGGGFWGWLGGLFGGGSPSGAGVGFGLGLGGGGSGGGGAPGGGGVAGGDVTPTGPSAGKRGWWTKERQQLAYETLRRGGVSDMGAKGLISRWMNVEASGGPTSVNHIGALGIAQWLGRRRTKLRQFAAARGKPWSDYETQLAFVLQEINGGDEPRAGRALRSASTIAEGATAASLYERAEGFNKNTGRDFFTNRTAGGMRGMDAYLSMPADTTPVGASGAASLSTIANDHSVTSSATSNAFHVGKMDIHTQATDAEGIAGSLSGAMHRAMRRGSESAAANYGLK